MRSLHQSKRAVPGMLLFIMLAVPIAGMLLTSEASAAGPLADDAPPSAHVVSESGAVSDDDSWVTFLGSAGTDSGGTRAVDDAGNIYVAGVSSATWGAPLRAFTPPTEDGWYPDVYVAKLDPTGHLLWNTFLGGSGNDYGGAFAFDSDGHIVICAESDRTWGDPDQPYSGESDIWLAALDPDGNLLWNTFLGGSGRDYQGSLLAAQDGGFYVAGDSYGAWGCGESNCTRRPLSAGIYATQDAFVAKVDAHGRLIWNTFLGGSKTDYQGRISVDEESGHIVVTGTSEDTWSCLQEDCTTRSFSSWLGSDPNLYVAELGSDGALLWNAFLGRAGNSWSAPSARRAANGEIYVSGTSGAAWSCASTPCTVRAFGDWDDGFAAKLDPSGHLIWNTFLGSDDTDSGGGLMLHEDGSITASGSSWGGWSCTEAPCTVRAYTGSQDAYIAKLNSDGELLWNSFIGSGSIDSGGIAKVDRAGRYYINGTSEGPWGSPERVYAGWDAYVAIMDPSGVLLWNTFIGGWERDYGFGMIFDGNGRAIVSGITEGTWGSPVRPFSGDRDTYVTALQLPGVPEDLETWLPLLVAK